MTLEKSSKFGREEKEINKAAAEKRNSGKIIHKICRKTASGLILAASLLEERSAQAGYTGKSSHSLEKAPEPGWQPPQYLMKGKIRAPLFSWQNDAGLDFQASTKIWDDDKMIVMGEAGARFNLNDSSWISVQGGGAANWFQDGSAAGALSMEHKLDLFTPQLYLENEYNLMIGESGKEFWGTEALKYKYFNYHLGLQSEQIAKRTLLFGGAAGVYSPHREIGFELQYLDGIMDDIRSRMVRVYFTFDLSLAKPPFIRAQKSPQ